MKVDRQHFKNADMYIRRINRCPLDKLDLSEFFEGDLTQAKKDFRLTGLENTDFITSDWIDRYPAIKRKFELYSPLRKETS